MWGQSVITKFLGSAQISVCNGYLAQCTSIASVTFTVEGAHSINASSITTAIDPFTFINVYLTPPSSEATVTGAYVNIHSINTVSVLSTDHTQTVVMAGNR